MPTGCIGFAVTLVVTLFAGIALGRAQTRPELPLPGYLQYTPGEIRGGTSVGGAKIAKQQPASTPMTQRTHLDS